MINEIHCKQNSQTLRRLCLILGLITSFQATAIDNPDAADYLTDFANKTKPYEDALSNSISSSDTAKAAGNYHDFLDAELNKIYKQLMSKLDIESQKRLKISQRAWLNFYEKETQFIIENWKPSSFGSSSTLSKAQYQNALTKERVKTLLGYLINYPN